MENKDFAVFVITHGRPDKVITYKTLKTHGYTGPIYIIIDNEDDKALKYYKNYGSEFVIMFDKKRIADLVDNGNNFGNRRTTTHARNACFEIAKKLSITYFVVLDDDYTGFRYRYINDKYITELTKIKPRSGRIKNMDKYFDIHLNFYKSINCKSIAFAQGGDFIGGEGCGLIQNYKQNSRKCMNSFFCSTERPFNFVGQLNEDVNTYVTLGSRGLLFLTLPFIALEQMATQKTSGGMTDAYLQYGTYAKSFTTVIMQPSSVIVNMMGSKVNRLHHRVAWRNTTPMIISENHKKDKNLVIVNDLLPEEIFKADNIVIDYQDLEIVKELSIAKVEYEKQDNAEVEIKETEPVELFTKPSKPPYFGLYSVSWTYDIFEQDKCIGKPRFTGTYSECEIFIIESKQPSLF